MRGRCSIRWVCLIASTTGQRSFPGVEQRVAIARALIRGPKLLLCDEPTGNLDRHTAEQVADLLLEVNQASKAILIVVTHSAELAARFPKSFELTEGGLRQR